MQESPLNPPPGGRAVRTELHPAGAPVGMGTVVGAADGGELVVVLGAAVVAVGRGTRITGGRR
jgi:hypothetical protein